MKRDAIRRCGRSVAAWLAAGCLSTCVLHAGAGTPWMQFANETVLDRLSLVMSNTNLDGETDYKANFSGCCLSPSRDELLIAINRSENFSKPPAIQVYDRAGNYLRHISLNDFNDVEGLCLYDAARNVYALVDESVNDITLVTITNGTTAIAKSEGVVLATGIAPGADGLEGVTYDTTRDVFYVVQELPMAVFQVSTNGGSVVSEELFHAPSVLAGLCTDLADIRYDPSSDHLFLLSDESKLIVECERDGTIIATRPIAGTQPEGIALVPGEPWIYLCGEPNELYGYEVAALSQDIAEGSQVDLTVILNTPATNVVSAGWSVTSATASPGLDFALPSTGTLTFAVGTSCATVSVHALPDTEVEGDEVLRVSLTNAAGAMLGTDDVHLLNTVNAPAAMPMLDDVPFDCAEVPTATPSFVFMSEDPDGVADIAYQLRWSTDAAFSNSITLRDSDADAGFENVEDGGDGNPYTGGERVRFSMQPGDALPDTPAGQAVYWQVRGRDVAAGNGSGEWGTWSSAQSFRVNSGLARSRWGQVTETQFAGGILDGTATSSNGVVLGDAEITFDNAGGGKIDNGTSIVIPGFAVADMPNRILVVGLSVRDNVSVSSITYAGSALTQLDAVQNGSVIGAQIWYLLNPPATTGQVAVTFAGNARAVAGVASWYHVDPSSPFGSVAKATGRGLEASVVASGETDSVIVDTVGLAFAARPVARGERTQLWGDYVTGSGFPRPMVAGAGSHRGGAASVTLTWTWQDFWQRNRDWAVIAVPLQCAPSARGTIVSPAIELAWQPPVVKWHELAFLDDETDGSICYDVQYGVGDAWRNTALTNLLTSPVDLSGLDPVAHGKIRLRATLTRDTDTPRLVEWGVTWMSTATCTVHVASEYGGLSPDADVLSVSNGTVLWLAVTNSPVAVGQATQYVCRGWTQTGCDPPSGAGNATAPYAVTNHALLTWQWQTQYWVSATAGEGGGVDGGNTWVPRGSNAVTVALPDSYYEFDRWSGDVDSGARRSAGVTTAVDSAKSLYATFTPELATNATPKPWLAGHYGPSNDFDSLALADTDGDGMPAWGEYRAGTIPTNRLSVLRMTRCARGTGGTEVCWSSVTTRNYAVYCSTDLSQPWPLAALASNLPGSATGTNTFVDPEQPLSPRYYRIETAAP